MVSVTVKQVRCEYDGTQLPREGKRYGACPKCAEDQATHAAECDCVERGLEWIDRTVEALRGRE